MADYWNNNVQALESAFYARTCVDLCDLPDIVCFDDIGVLSDRPMSRGEIAEALEYLMEEHADNCGFFADAFGM